MTRGRIRMRRIMREKAGNGRGGKDYDDDGE